MKLLVYTYLLFVAFACSSSKEVTQEVNADSKYYIRKIKNKNSWCIIYAEKQDTLFKIVVGTSNVINDDCKEIAVGKYYDFELKSKRENAPKINGVGMNPINYLDIECYSYDEETDICIEPKKGINDLYYTEDLLGLYYLR